MYLPQRYIDYHCPLALHLNAFPIILKSERMHHRSPSSRPKSLHYEVEPSMIPDHDFKMEHEYLSKLRSQRERIQKLYSNYEQSLATISLLTQENTSFKDTISSLQERLGIQAAFNEMECKFLIADGENNDLRHEIEELRSKYEVVTVENTRKFKELKQHYALEREELALENGMLKENNRAIETRGEQIKVELHNEMVQANELRAVMERLKKELTESYTKSKTERAEWQIALKERDEQIVRLKGDTVKLKDQSSEQAYLFELEREKTQEILGEYISTMGDLRRQIQQLQSQLLLQLQQNNNCITNQETQAHKARQAQSSLHHLRTQMQSLRIHQQQAHQRLQFLHTEELRKLNQKIQFLEGQIKLSNREFEVLITKHERLQQMMKKREMKENAMKQLVSYGHQEIDRMNFILKM